MKGALAKLGKACDAIWGDESLDPDDRARLVGAWQEASAEKQFANWDPARAILHAKGYLALRPGKTY